MILLNQLVAHLPLVFLLSLLAFGPFLCPVLAEYRGQVTQPVTGHFCGLALPQLTVPPPPRLCKEVTGGREEVEYRCSNQNKQVQWRDIVLIATAHLPSKAEALVGGLQENPLQPGEIPRDRAWTLTAWLEAH